MVFGAAYFLLAVGPWTEWGPAGIKHHPDPSFNPILPTSEAANWLAGSICEPMIPKPSAPDGDARFVDYYESYSYVEGAAHLLFIWPFGAAGGLMAMMVRRRFGTGAPGTAS